MDRVGIIGTGVMGRTIAESLIKSGRRVMAYDSFPQVLAKAVEIGTEAVKSPLQIMEQVDIILLLLPGPVEIQSCMTAPNGILSADCKDKLIVDMCTSDPSCTVEMAALTREKGGDYLDAPILGRPSTVGKWALPVGGNKESLEKCRHILNIFAANILHIGDSGSGHKLKLLNQMMFGAINAMTAEMMAISEKVGINPAILYDTILASQAGTVSNLFKELGARVATDNYSQPTFTVDLLNKDIHLGIKMAKEHNAPPILGRSVELINEMAQAQGLGKEDTSLMWKSLKPVWASFGIEE